MVTFVFDPNKSKSNKKKHGIDFIEAQPLWDDPDLILIPSHLLDEERYIAIGSLLEKIWSAIITYRDADIRIISVRRSRRQEIEIYEKAKSF